MDIINFQVLYRHKAIANKALDIHVNDSYPWPRIRCGCIPDSCNGKCLWLGTPKQPKMFTFIRENDILFGILPNYFAILLSVLKCLGSQSAPGAGGISTTSRDCEFSGQILVNCSTEGCITFRLSSVERKRTNHALVNHRGIAGCILQ